MMNRAAPLLMLALVGCCDAAPPSVVCPHARDYPAAEQIALEAELSRDGPVTQAWLRDYVALRAQIRACVLP